MGARRPFLLVLAASVLALAVLFATRAAQSTVIAERNAEPPATKKTETPRAKPDRAGARRSGGSAAARGTAARSRSKSASKASPTRRREPALAGIPRRVSRALQRKRVVVLFFRQPGADDDATAAAVSSLRGRRNVSVFKDGIRRLARYRSIVSGLGISQAPAVVVVSRRREAVLLEGFVDRGSLSQQVADAR